MTAPAQNVDELSLTPPSNVDDDAPAADADADAAGGPLSRFELRGYRPPPDLSEDETYMDVVMIVARTSTLRQGSMGCLLVRPPPNATATATMREGEETPNGLQRNNEPAGGDRGGGRAERLLGRIIAAATNTSLFRPGDSDVHAEINAIGQVAQRRTARPRPSSNSSRDDAPPHHSTMGATAYISMPPCKRCFGALYAAGVRRIVSRRPHPDALTRAASGIGMELACLTREECEGQRERLDRLFVRCERVVDDDGAAGDGIRGMDGDAGGDEADDEVDRRRRQRKEEKRARKMAKMTKVAKGNAADGDACSGD